MIINKEFAKNAFKSYTDNFDPANPKIKLKIDHTYRVADLCETISKSLGLSPYDVNLCYFIGLLHDVGRFEQIRQFNTFSDADSIPHAKLSADLLFNNRLILNYFECISNYNDFSNSDIIELKIVETAIRSHSLFVLPNDLDDKTLLFSKILRDADKIDIIKVNAELPCEDIYNISLDELKKSDITPAVKDAFKEHHAILRSLKQYPADNIVGHVSLMFELEFPISYKIVRQQGYLDKVVSFESDNPKSQEFIEYMRTSINEYIASKCSEY